MIETYNDELSRWIRAGFPKPIDNFVVADERKIKWCSRLKECFARKIEAKFKATSIRNSLYRPFTSQFLYFDSMMTHRQGMFPTVFPAPPTEVKNAVICVSGIGSSKPFQCLISDTIPGHDLLEKTQCFPFYVFAEDGSNQRENITDWALKQFQAQYGPDISKRDIFSYIYAILHHPTYRERYAENLKRDLPHIPLLKERSAFELCVYIGKRLTELHLNYEEAPEHPLKWIENKEMPVNWHVEKMQLTPNKDALMVNEWITMTGIPPKCFHYRLGNRSALEWVIDQYQVSTDARSGITSDPNRIDDERYIVRLVGQVVTVSIETVKLVEELAREVTQEDWMSEMTDSIVIPSLAESVE